MTVHNKQIDLKKILFWTSAWIGSMFLFAYIFTNKGLVQNMSSIELLFAFLVTIFGIVSFIIVILDIEKSIKQNNDWIIASVFSVLTLFLFLGIGVGILIFAFYILPKPQNNEVQVNKSIDTLIPSPIKINPPSTQNTTLNNADSNPIVNCNVHVNCGGGYKNIRRNECENSICCEVGGKWYFYTDKNKCNQDQQAYNNSQNSNSSQTTTTNYTFPTTPPQNNTVQSPTLPPPQPQQAVDNTAAREQCIGNVNSTLSSSIVDLRNYCRAIGTNGSYYDTEKARLENEATNKRNQCNSMYP